MKKYILLLFFSLTSVLLKAQEKELTWLTDFNQAMEVSVKEKKPLLLFFTGSDWCGWCIRLQKDVFFKHEFSKWAKDNVVLVELDFPKKKVLSAEMQQQNYGLQNALKVRGYPSIWFVTAEKKSDGNISLNALGSTGYVAGGPEAWLAGANQILANTKKG